MLKGSLELFSTFLISICIMWKLSTLAQSLNPSPVLMRSKILTLNCPFWLANCPLLSVGFHFRRTVASLSSMLSPTNCCLKNSKLKIQNFESTVFDRENNFPGNVLNVLDQKPSTGTKSKWGNQLISYNVGITTNSRTIGMAELTKQALPTPNDTCLKPVTANFYRTKEKEAGNWPFK